MENSEPKYEISRCPIVMSSDDIEVGVMECSGKLFMTDQNISLPLVTLRLVEDDVIKPSALALSVIAAKSIANQLNKIVEQQLHQ